MLWGGALLCLIAYVARVWFTSPEYRKHNFERMKAEMSARERERERKP